MDMISIHPPPGQMTLLYFSSLDTDASPFPGARIELTGVGNKHEHLFFYILVTTCNSDYFSLYGTKCNIGKTASLESFSLPRVFVRSNMTHWGEKTKWQTPILAMGKELITF